MASFYSSLPPPPHTRSALPRSSVVLSSSDFHRISNFANVHTAPPTYRSLDASAPATSRASGDTDRVLQLLSSEAASKWNNTLEGSRRKKLEAKRKQLEDEEAKRVQLDAEEVVIQQAARRATIEQTQRMLRDQGDRYKTFTGALMLSDVIAQREQHKEWKQQLQQMESDRDAHHTAMEAERHRMRLECEVKEQEAAKNKSATLKGVRERQLGEFKYKKIIEMEQEIKAGEELKLRAAEALQQQKDADKRKIELQREALAEADNCNKNMQKLKQEEAMRLAEEEKQIEEYARKQDNRKQMIQQRQAEIARKKLDVRMRLIDTQAEVLKTLEDRENKRVEKAQEEVLRKTEQTFLDKQEYQRRQREMIETQRKQQLQLRQQQQQEDRDETIRMTEHFKTQMEQLRLTEIEEKQRKRAEADKLAVYRKEQMRSKRDAERREKRQEQLYVQKTLKQHQTEENEFASFGKSCLEIAAKLNRDTKPLEKALKDYEKTAVLGFT
eukprot:GHVQ01012890.1.p1 GENE.GHVQ01012890.1~~GHVQ01012890.1.p1  ORF type:complete len:498 (+),score=109.81 GHVQ01012890.1:176-1669(+)